MSKRHPPKFSLAPVQYRQSNIAGKGVFARRHFAPGDVVVPYAPKQRRLPMNDPEAVAAAATKLSLLSENCWVILPDTSVPGGWLCNHSCDPNAALYSDGAARIQCLRPISPGQEVTIFYGWVTYNQPAGDPCHCGSTRCRGFINFDISAPDIEQLAEDTEHSLLFRERLVRYYEYLRAIDQEQVIDVIDAKIAWLEANALSEK